MIGKGMPIEQTIRWLKTLNERLAIRDEQMNNIFHVTAENAINYLEIERQARWINERIIADSTKTERLKGEWIEENRRPKSGQFQCSVCHRIAYDPQPTRLEGWVKRCRYKFCPNCGADMRNEQ